MNKRGVNGLDVAILKDSDGFVTWKRKDELNSQEPVTTSVNQNNTNPSYAKNFCYLSNPQTVLIRRGDLLTWDQYPTGKSLEEAKKEELAGEVVIPANVPRDFVSRFCQKYNKSKFNPPS